MHIAFFMPGFLLVLWKSAGLGSTIVVKNENIEDSA